MYHYLEDRDFEHRMRKFGGEVMQAFCHTLKEDHDIGATFCLIGSGRRNLITQNARQPVDLDYNLEILRCDDIDDCRGLKQKAQKALDKALSRVPQYYCRDSTSVLTSKLIRLRSGDPIFTIDVCIIFRDEDGQQYRLIHEKTGFSWSDRYFWNEAPSARDVGKKAEYIRQHGQWESLREEYLRLKNHYLSRGESGTHPSYICYAEAVSIVYSRRNRWK